MMQKQRGIMTRSYIDAETETLNLMQTKMRLKQQEVTYINQRRN